MRFYHIIQWFSALNTGANNTYYSAGRHALVVNTGRLLRNVTIYEGTLSECQQMRAELSRNNR
jgi:hypothetical protein